MDKEKQQQIKYQLLLFKTRIFEGCRGSFRCFYERVALLAVCGSYASASRVHGRLQYSANCDQLFTVSEEEPCFWFIFRVRERQWVPKFVSIRIH